mmetsp:Transcript_5950/g.13280  ORF Transcript_5950/g.13280 Transcript_5950/m.13280 type:complete len:594 (+) Transcript_5950:61-1842(+)
MAFLSMFHVSSFFLAVGKVADSQQLVSPREHNSQEILPLIDAFLEAFLTFGTLLAVTSLARAAKGCLAADRVQVKKTELKAKHAPPAALQKHSKARERPAIPTFPSSLKRKTWCDQMVQVIRDGRAASLPTILDEARLCALSDGLSLRSRELEEMEIEHLASCLRGCASHQAFREAIWAYEHMEGRIGKGNRAIWSVLLYCTVQISDFDRCKLFFERLCALGAPSGKDFVNIVNFLAHKRDATGLLQLLSDATTLGCRVSTFDWNRALAVCTRNNALDLAEILAGSEACSVFAAEMDVVGFNTMMKAYSTAGSTSSCLAVLEKMRAARLSPSNTTFGILLDCCVKAKEYDLAAYVFGQIQHCGLKPNVVHYTTLMKGFADAHRLPEATALLEEMRSSPSLRPDFMTFSTIIKAYADHGSTERALEILKEMIASGIPPDGFIFHSVLGGCSVRRMKGDEVVDVLHELISLGLKPSNATLGCLIRALVGTRSFDMAMNLILTASEELGVQPQARIYVQLAKSCADLNYAKKALEVYQAMARAALDGKVQVHESINLRLHRYCSSCGRGEEASFLFNTVSNLQRGAPPALKHHAVQ